MLRKDKVLNHWMFKLFLWSVALLGMAGFGLAALAWLMIVISMIKKGLGL